MSPLQAHQCLLETCQSDTYSILQRFLAAKDVHSVAEVLQLVLKEASPAFQPTSNGHSTKANPLASSKCVVGRTLLGLPSIANLMRLTILLKHRLINHQACTAGDSLREGFKHLHWTIFRGAPVCKCLVPCQVYRHGLAHVSPGSFLSVLKAGGVC